MHKSIKVYLLPYSYSAVRERPIHSSGIKKVVNENNDVCAVYIFPVVEIATLLPTRLQLVYKPTTNKKQSKVEAAEFHFTSP